MDVSWEMHEASATGTISGQGSTHLDTPLGQRATTTIQVSAPSTGTAGVLMLQSSKNGTAVFRDDGEVLQPQ